MPNRFPRYERLLKLYPAAYRQQYGPQMSQTVADMLDDATDSKQRQLVWAKVAVDLPISVTKAQLQYMGGVMRNETPKYVKETGLLTSLLVLPFFAALAANGLDKLINNHTLYSSWLWRMPVIGLWVLWLPGIAFGLTLVSYLIFAFKPGKTSRGTWLRRASDIKHAWPVVLPGIIAFGILFILAFHDSAHCWAQNPVRFVTGFHQTLRCTKNGFIGG